MPPLTRLDIFDSTATPLHLEARLTLKGLLPQIVAYVEVGKWVATGNVIGGCLKGLSKSLTEVSKVASKRLLNPDFERLPAR